MVWFAAPTPKPLLANASHSAHALAPPKRFTSACSQASRALRTIYNETTFMLERVIGMRSCGIHVGLQGWIASESMNKWRKTTLPSDVVGSVRAVADHP